MHGGGPRWAALITVLATGVAITACAGTPDGEPPATPAALGPVTVSSGLRFATEAPAVAPWTDPVLDVYAPHGGSGLPLVVLLPAHALTKDSSAAYEQIARSIAERGAVVYVANWSQHEDPPGTFTDPEVLDALAELDRSVAGCAVSYAVHHAADRGADPTRLVVGGELYGANIASLIAGEEPAAYPDCIVTADWQAQGLLGLDGDWLVGMPAFDPVADAAIENLTPWPLLPERIPARVALAVSEPAARATRTCQGSDPAWLTARDPDGALRRWLGRVRAFADGCVDLGDAADALAAALRAAGSSVVVVDLANADGRTRVDAGGHLEDMGARDLAALADAAIALTDRSDR